MKYGNIRPSYGTFKDNVRDQIDNLKITTLSANRSSNEDRSNPKDDGHNQTRDQNRNSDG
jgi:hypothetical protein